LKKVIVSVTTDLISDQRVHKTCLTLHENGYNVLLVGRKLNNEKCSQRPYQIKRLKFFLKKGFLFYVTFNIRLFFFLLFNKCDIFFSNDLDTLMPNFLASRIKRKKMIYDSHELFLEVPELIGKKFVKFFWSQIEKNIFPKLTHIITVSESIANFYNQKYKVPISVVKNVPFKSKKIDKQDVQSHSFLLDTKLNLDMSKKNIIYQGSLNKDRGIQLMIRMMLHVDAKLFIIGSGDLKKELIELVSNLSLTKKIIFLGRIPFQHLKLITPKFDIGLSFEEDTCLSYRYSLPNKIFDYIQAGVPVLVSELPEMSKIVKDYNVGEVLKYRDPKKIAQQLNHIFLKKDFFEKNLIIAQNKFCWELEEKNLINVFNSL